MRKVSSLSAEQRFAVDCFMEAMRSKAGFRPDAIQHEVIWRAAATHLKTSPAALDGEKLRSAVQSDSQLERTIWETMLVAETYFFRHPEHFLLVSDWVSQRHTEGNNRFRAWSAGCSSGEEAFSLAASILSLGRDVEVEVLGTDISERSLHRAREGKFGAWSRRSAGPLLFPLGENQGGDGNTFQVHPKVAGSTRFLTHNLLEPLPEPEGDFDIVFCRNVLVYLEERSAQRVCRHLSDRLRPGGILVLGNLDAQFVPSGMERLAFGEAHVVRRPANPSPPARIPTTRKPEASVTLNAVDPFARARSPEDPVAKHVQALVQLERGHHREARLLLLELERSSPDYLPAVLEQALLSGRRGEHAHARQRMRELLQRLDGLPDDRLLSGPEELPVAYYRASAEAFLRGAAEAQRHAP